MHCRTDLALANDYMVPTGKMFSISFFNFCIWIILVGHNKKCDIVRFTCDRALQAASR